MTTPPLSDELRAALELVPAEWDVVPSKSRWHWQFVKLGWARFRYFRWPNATGYRTEFRRTRAGRAALSLSISPEDGR